jgi:hypothetical protein
MKRLSVVAIVVLTLILPMLVSCGAATATPVPQATAATTTADTATPEAPAPTATPEPTAPSATPQQATAVPPTATAEPPTATAELPTAAESPTATTVAELAISSPAFQDGGRIPVEYSCWGDNVSPALEWSGVPAGAESLALLVTDPDAGPALGASTNVGFAHWIVFDIPPGKTGYAQDRPGGETLPDGARQGRNDFGQFSAPGQVLPGRPPTKVLGYDGPCPPAEHHYAFTLYALDTTLGLPPGAELADVLTAMEGHVLAQAQVIGLFAPLQ